jgi:hypothetical protein
MDGWMVGMYHLILPNGYTREVAARRKETL